MQAPYGVQAVRPDWLCFQTREFTLTRWFLSCWWGSGEPQGERLENCLAISLFMTLTVIVANIAHSATSKEFQGCLSEEVVLNPILTQNMC